MSSSRPFRKNKKTNTFTALRELSRSDIIGMAKELLTRKFRKNISLGSTADTKNYLYFRFVHLEHEAFVCLFLDAQHRVIASEQLFSGTIDHTSIHVREVVKKVLHHNAAAVVFAHNHPSGVAEPSSSDKKITDKLVWALRLIDVTVLDHIVVGSETATSFAERELL